jgi:hypothetical protein
MALVLERPLTPTRAKADMEVTDHMQCIKRDATSCDARDRYRYPGRASSRAMSEDTFINYSTLDDLKEKSKRRKVSSYIGLHFRNRSKPLAKRNARLRTGIDEAVADAESEGARPAASSQVPRHPQVSLAQSLITLPRDGHGVRSDPFETWPIEFDSSIPSAIDYCK